MFKKGLFVFVSVYITVFTNRIGIAEVPDPIALPPVNILENAKDFDFSLPETWMREIQANVASTNYDVAVRAELTMLRKPKGLPEVPLLNFATFRRIARPDGARRTICILQSELTNAEIGEDDIGKIVDGARHCDLLVVDGKAVVTFVGAGQYGLVPDKHLTTEEQMQHNLRQKMVFDPCRAATVGLTQIAAGRAMDLSRHSVLTSLVRGTLRRGGDDHVLLQIGSIRQILTFRKKVPVQMVFFMDIDEKSQKPIPFERTISRWALVGKNLQLPIGIWAQRDHQWNSGNMTAKLSWIVGDKVDQKLFQDDNLGSISTVRDREL